MRIKTVELTSLKMPYRRDTQDVSARVWTNEGVFSFVFNPKTKELPVGKIFNKTLEGEKGIRHSAAFPRSPNSQWGKKFLGQFFDHIALYSHLVNDAEAAAAQMIAQHDKEVRERAITETKKAHAEEMFNELKEITRADPIDLALDPTWPQRLAQQIVDKIEKEIKDDQGSKAE